MPDMNNMNDPEKMFEEWYLALCTLAKSEGLLWLISNEKEDHREGYLDGNTPEEELDEMKYAAVT